MFTLAPSSINTNTELDIPSSKSISNRALIIKSLSKEKCNLFNISTARDTNTMLKLLNSNQNVWNVRDAGTTMRFLTAYATVTGQQVVLTGTERMQERPIKLLVDALTEIGAKISYEKKDGYPPIKIIGFDPVNRGAIHMQGNVSSQYISALLMVAPLLPGGLKIQLTPPIYSVPYINMTMNIMEHFGARAQWTDANTIEVQQKNYGAAQLTIEPDWSGASYWLSAVSIAQSGTIEIKNISKKSLQGDAAIMEIMKNLGVESIENKNGIVFAPTKHYKAFEYDFRNCPDLAQTVMVACAANKINAKFTGLESLKIKETDRVAAMQNELAKLNAHLLEEGDAWELYCDEVIIPERVFINTYDDHRMAMAFAPLSLITELTIEDPSVVNKSYPSFWEDFEKIKRLKQ